MTYFKTERIELIAIEEKHLDLITDWINDERINATSGPRFPISKSQQKKWFESISSNRSKQKLLVKDNDGQLVGMVSLMNIDNRNRNCEIAVYIVPNAQGKGYAKASLQQLINFAFFELNMHKIYANIFDYNAQSCRLFESLGFTHESTSKETVFTNNKFIDVFTYTLFNKN